MEAGPANDAASSASRRSTTTRSTASVDRLARRRVRRRSSGTTASWPARRSTAGPHDGAVGRARSRSSHGLARRGHAVLVAARARRVPHRGRRLRPRRVRHDRVRRVAPRSSPTGSASSSPTGSRWRSSQGIELEVRFYHCNERHHTVALARAPFELPQRLHHVMFETNDRDDVGARLRPGVGRRSSPIPNGLGRHDNDGMFSFYVAEPGRLPGRGRPRRPRRSPTTGTTTAGTTGSARGATSRSRSAHERRRPMTSRVRTDVAIVGYGPVGTDAGDPARPARPPVVVLERWPEPYPLPRAVHFDHEVGRILQACGVGDELAGDHRARRHLRVAQRRPATTLLRFGRHGDRRLRLAGVDDVQPARARGAARRRGRELPGDRASAAASRSIGLDDARATTVRRRGGAPTATDACERRVTSSAATAPTAPCAPCSALPVHDLGFFYDWLIVDVDPRTSRACSTRSTCRSAIRPGRRPRCRAGPGAGAGSSCACPTSRSTSSNDERPAWELLAPWDVHPGNATLERHAVYTFQARWAERWRRARAARRRRRAPDAAVRRAGHVLGPARRRQPRLEARPGARRVSRPRPLLDTLPEERLPQRQGGRSSSRWRSAR